MRTAFNLINDVEARRLLEQGASVAEVANACGVSRQAVYNAIRKGRLPAPLKKST